MVEARSYSWPGVCWLEVSASAITGACDGFTLRCCGSPGMPLGSWLRAVLIAACTSRAASFMLRSRSKLSWMRALPCELAEFMSTRPGIVPSARSSGAVTFAAMLSGLAPGRLALTSIEGESTCGSGATGSRR
jgi:hypothetical protein